MITKNINVIDKGSWQAAMLIIDHNEITFSYITYHITKKGDYPFMVLKEIREDLDKQNIFLVINGSRKDVFPSGMSLVGTMAYVQNLGKPTSLDDLVDIFSETDKVELISTVEDQQKYHLEWLNSIRG